MQLSRDTVALFEREAPQLLDAVDTGEAEFIMKRDPQTDYCVKFDAGWCGIHRDYGSDFLGDACHFYPRVTRAFDDTVTTTLALSCPEAARLMVLGESSLDFGPRDELRVPFTLTNYLPASMPVEDALALHQLFIEQLGKDDAGPERQLMRIMAVARALEMQPQANWLAAARFYLTIADSRLPTPAPHISDPAYLVQALTGLVQASKATDRPVLEAVQVRMREAVGLVADAAGQSGVLAPDALERTVALYARWERGAAAAMQPLLHRYLQAQLSQAGFPFAGLGGSMPERLLIIAVRYATLKLALMAHMQADGSPADDATNVQIIYTLSRFMDHLADPALSLAIYAETGWAGDARLRALLGDA